MGLCLLVLLLLMLLVGGVKKEREEMGRHVQYLMPFDPTYEVGFGGVQVEQRLGEGAFGVVFRGTVMHLPGGVTGPLAVAIKTLRGGFGFSFSPLPFIHFRLFTQLSTYVW